MFEEDMSVFFDAETHADNFFRQRPSQPLEPFVGIVGVQSKDAVGGYAVGDFRELLYPTGAIELKDGDLVLLLRPDVATATFRVRGDAELVNDGSESRVKLSEVRP